MCGEEKGNMGTTIRPELSGKNKYWISRHRYYELKHFCLQYPMWKKVYSALEDLDISSARITGMPSSNNISDITAEHATVKAYYSNRIQMVEDAAIKADPELCDYILKAVTEGLSYTNLKARLEIPCGKDMYYDRYRRFFWLLSKSRN